MTNAIVPMPPFEWQKDLWMEYYKLVRDDRLPHAILLAGQEGIGLESLSLAMGQYLLCTSPIESMACGKCKGCQLLRAGTHPDLLMVRPEEKSKYIRVDQVRKIGNFVAKTAQQSGFKVVVIEPAEDMNISAANAMLKNLEEPSDNTVFVLVCYRLNGLLPTIRSRCRQYLLRSPAAEQASAWLDSVGLSNAKSLLFEAMNAPLLVKKWHDEGTAEKRHQLVADLENIANHVIEPLAFAGKWSKEEPVNIVGPMIRCTEIVLANKMASQAAPQAYDGLLKALEDCSSMILFRLLEHLKIKKHQALSSPNLNSMLFIEELALDWAVAAKKQ